MQVAAYLMKHYSGNPEGAKDFLMEMHERYIRHRVRDGFAAADGKYRNLAWFMTSESTKYAIAEGTLVKEHVPSGKFDFAIVTGYSDTTDRVLVQTGRGQLYSYDVELLDVADVPTQILEIARQQIASERTLPKGRSGCRS